MNCCENGSFRSCCLARSRLNYYDLNLLEVLQGCDYCWIWDQSPCSHLTCNEQNYSQILGKIHWVLKDSCSVFKSQVQGPFFWVTCPTFKHFKSHKLYGYLFKFSHYLNQDFFSKPQALKAKVHNEALSCPLYLDLAQDGKSSVRNIRFQTTLRHLK